jgi:hypothetical protein
MKEFFKTDIYIPSIGEKGVEYTKVDKDFANEAANLGYLSSPDLECPASLPRKVTGALE